MDAPGGSRKTSLWPLLAISLLVLLLSAFLVLQFMKPDRTPSVVKEPPPPSEPPPAKETGAPEPPPVPAPKPPAVDDRLERFVASIGKAAAEKRWDDAERELKQARALALQDERLDALRHKIEEGRQAERKREEEERKKFAEALATLKEKVDALLDKEKYEAAVKEAEAFREAQPYALKSREFLDLFNATKETYAQARSVFDKAMEEARAHLQAGRHPEAFKALQKARLIYPDGTKEVAALESQLKEATLYGSMRRIPEQLCWIGSDEAPEEAPLRRVKLPAFYIDKYQVTNADYLLFCEATGHRRPPYWRGKPGRPNPQFLKHPVVFVDHSDAEAYAKWAGKRLPTAEEWEVAARGFDKRIYPWGNVFAEKENEFPCNCLEFWQLNKQFSRGTTAVDDPRFANNVSPWGVYGMAGNVWEYTSTRAERAGSGREYVLLKGGSFMTPAKAQRASNIYEEEGAHLHPDVGFRCVRDPK